MAFCGSRISSDPVRRVHRQQALLRLQGDEVLAAAHHDQAALVGLGDATIGLAIAVVNALIK